MTTATLSVEPARLGPTWERNADGSWFLPKLSLGWSVLKWTGQWLKHQNNRPWRYTPEQARFILWWFAVDSDMRFLYRDGVLQRLKGWGKDPVGSTICAVEFVGPSRPSGEFEKFTVPGSVDPWQPSAVQHPAAWVQVAAVAKEQTKNTMTLFPSLFTKAAISEYGIDLGKEILYADQGRARLEAVTSSPLALEGPRSTFVLRNETQNWFSSNGGHEMDRVIDGNVVKAADGNARALSICNAYRPGLDSVAERARGAYDAMVSGQSTTTGLLYDSLEAPADAPLTAEAAPAVIAGVRGDSVWLPIVGIVQSILDPRNSPSESRRKWYNQITATEDAWLSPFDVDAAAVPPRRVLHDGLLNDRFDDDEITLFFDGSKSDDATGLVACRVADGHLFTVGVWQKPPGDRGKGWQAPRGVVDSRVDEAFRRYKVVAFYADPSHVKDDEGERYWDGLVDDWHRRYAHRIDKKLWAVQSGDNRSAFMWDMTSHERQALFTGAAERFVADAEGRSLTHDAHPLLTQHLKNAKRLPNAWGVSLTKEHRESAKKIDLAVCAVGARMLYRVVLNLRASQKQRSGKAVFL